MRQSGLALVLGLAILWVPLAAGAQQTGKVWRIGVLMPDRSVSRIRSSIEGLRETTSRPTMGANMTIDIDRLTEAELIDLNNRVVERLRFLNQMRAHGEMLRFKIGDRVSFHPEGHPVVVGMLTRYNRKTVTVITDSGQRWNVSPTLLRRPDSSNAAEDLAPNVIQLRKT